MATTKLQSRLNDFYENKKEILGEDYSTIKNIADTLGYRYHSHKKRGSAGKDILENAVLSDESKKIADKLFKIEGNYIKEIQTDSKKRQIADYMDVRTNVIQTRRNLRKDYLPQVTLGENINIENYKPSFLRRAGKALVKGLIVFGAGAVLTAGVYGVYNQNKKTEEPIKPVAPVKSEIKAEEVYSVKNNTKVIANVQKLIQKDIERKVKASEFVGPIQKVEVKKIKNKRPTYYDYNFNEYPKKLKKSADEKWEKGDKLGGLVTRLGSSVALINDVVEYPVARPVLGTLGGTARTIEKGRWFEKALSFIGIKKPYENAKKKDNSDEKVFAIGYQGGEDVATFTMDGTIGGEGFDILHSETLKLNPKKGLEMIYERESTKLNGHLKTAEILSHYIPFFTSGHGHGGHGGNGSGGGGTGGSPGGSPGGIAP